MMKCFSEHIKLWCNFLLLIAILNTNFVSCDILLNQTTASVQKNASACDGDQCNAQQNKVIRDQRMLIVDYVQESNLYFNGYNDRLKHISILYGIILAAQENELNQRCYNEIMQIYDGINHKEIWAIKGELILKCITIFSFVFSKHVLNSTIIVKPCIEHFSGS